MDAVKFATSKHLQHYRSSSHTFQTLNNPPTCFVVTDDPIVTVVVVVVVDVVVVVVDVVVDDDVVVVVDDDALFGSPKKCWQEHPSNSLIKFFKIPLFASLYVSLYASLYVSLHASWYVSLYASLYIVVNIPLLYHNCMFSFAYSFFPLLNNSRNSRNSPLKQMLHQLSLKHHLSPQTLTSYSSLIIIFTLPPSNTPSFSFSPNYNIYSFFLHQSLPSSLTPNSSHLLKNTRIEDSLKTRCSFSSINLRRLCLISHVFVVMKSSSCS